MEIGVTVTQNLGKARALEALVAVAALNAYDMTIFLDVLARSFSVYKYIRSTIN